MSAPINNNNARKAACDCASVNINIRCKAVHREAWQREARLRDMTFSAYVVAMLNRDELPNKRSNLLIDIFK